MPSKGDCMPDALLVLPMKILRATAAAAKALARKGEQFILVCVFVALLFGLMAVVAAVRSIGGRG